MKKILDDLCNELYDAAFAATPYIAIMLCLLGLSLFVLIAYLRSDWILAGMAGVALIAMAIAVRQFFKLVRLIDQLDAATRGHDPRTSKGE